MATEQSGKPQQGGWMELYYLYLVVAMVGGVIYYASGCSGKKEEPDPKKDGEVKPDDGKKPGERAATGGTRVLERLDQAEQDRKRDLAATTNDLKKEKVETDYRAKVKSLVGENVILKVSVGSVDASGVHPQDLPVTLDPDLQKKADEEAQRQLRGEKPKELPNPVYVRWDFSGTDRGDRYQKPSLGGGGMKPAKKDPNPIVSSIPSDRFDADTLRKIDKGTPLTIEGQIVSVATYSEELSTAPYKRFLVTIKLGAVTVGKQ